MLLQRVRRALCRKKDRHHRDISNMVKAIVGANWGDEGKGKITDMLSQEADIIVRFQGGSNAGHTIKNNYGKFALHMLPSGVFYNHTTSILGNGVALNIPYMCREIDEIVSKGVPKPKILVSDRAQILMPYHILFDECEEERLAGKAFGSTKSGIAPFYSDKYAKIGFQVQELFMDEAELRDKVERVCVQKNILLKHLYNRDTANVFHGLFVHCFQCGHILAHKLCIISTHHLFQKDDADPHRYQTANSQPPVKEENQNNNRNRHDGCTGQIRELMGQEPFCKSCIIINDFPQPSTGILAEIAQRQCHNMVNCCFPHIGRCTKRRQVGTVQSDEIN